MVRSQLKALGFGLAMALVFKGGEAHAQDMSYWLGESGKDVSVSFEHQRMQEPKDHSGPSVEEQKGAIQVPLYDNGTTSFSGLMRGSRTLLGESIRFPSRGVEIPREFGTVEAGLSVSHKGDDENRTGLVTTIGSAGTQLLANGETPLVNANLFFDRKAGPGSSWLYFVNYSNNRTRWNNIPIPGFAYSTGGPTYRVVAGLPFVFAMWRPDPWALSTTLSPFFASVDASYRFWGPLQGFSLLAWTPRAYQNVIEGSDERLLFDKKELGFGVKMSLDRKTSFSAGYTYNFGRRLLIGKSISDSSADTITLQNSGGVHLRAKIAF